MHPRGKINRYRNSYMNEMGCMSETDRHAGDRPGMPSTVMARLVRTDVKLAGRRHDGWRPVMARRVARAYAHLGSTIGLSGQDHLPAGTRYGSLACGPLRRQDPRCPAHWEPSAMRAWTTEAVSSLNRC